MSTINIIIITYIALNLLMLVFKPVREGWIDFLRIYIEWPDIYKDFFNKKTFKEARWWEILLIVPLVILASLLVLIWVVVMTFIPIWVYKNAINSTKHSIAPKHIIPDRYHWGANTDQNRITFDLNLPFMPNTHEVIYVEYEHDPVVNEYILEHFDELQKQFQAIDVNFVYIPKHNDPDVQEETLMYMFPYLTQDSSYTKHLVTAETLKKHIANGSIVGPAMIHYLEEYESSDNYLFSYCPLVPDSIVSLSDQFKWYVNSVRNSLPGRERYRVALPQGDEVADACFNDGDEDSASAYAPYMDLEDHKIIQEIRDRIHQLRLKGYKLGLLNDLVEEKPTLSRLVIDKDYRIFLPDYNNIEITMSPLPKAVFLLFLRHPEGISFKQLSDHYTELLNIYREVGNREVEENIKNSIRDITDPTKNSINEKCTRIREAFLQKFDYAYAKYYYITGKRGEPKRIMLPRELLDLQAL